MLPPLSDKPAAARSNADGVEYADAAIAMDPRNSAAHQLRGLFAVTAWLMPMDGTSDSRDRDDAERYLRTAVELDATAAQAWSALSSIFIAKGEFGEAYFAAERAYAADTYLDVADAATANLFGASLELGNVEAAERWCADISRRSKGSWVGAYCQVNLLARSGRVTREDADHAQRLVNVTLSNADNAVWAPVLNSVLGVIYARLGDVRLASKMLATTDAGPMREEAQPFKAWALCVLGGHVQAQSILDSYVNKNPSVRGGLLRSVRFASLR
jgi:tetratricopeptide (TPR) repeat protein